MKKPAAKEAKKNFDFLLNTTRHEPVMIEKSGCVVTVMLSREEFERLEAVENAFLVMQTQLFDKQRYLGWKKSEKLLRDLLNA